MGVDIRDQCKQKYKHTSHNRKDPYPHEHNGSNQKLFRTCNFLLGIRGMEGFGIRVIPSALRAVGKANRMYGMAVWTRHQAVTRRMAGGQIDHCRNPAKQDGQRTPHTRTLVAVCFGVVVHRHPQQHLADYQHEPAKHDHQNKPDPSGNEVRMGIQNQSAPFQKNNGTFSILP